MCKMYLSFSIVVYVIFLYEKVCIKYTQFIFGLFFDIFYVSLKKSQLSIGHKVLFRSHNLFNFGNVSGPYADPMTKSKFVIKNA